MKNVVINVVKELEIELDSEYRPPITVTEIICQVDSVIHSIGKDETNGLISYTTWELIDGLLSELVNQLKVKQDGI